MTNTTTSIDTLVEDIHNLFRTPGGHVSNEDNLHKMGEEMKEVVSSRLKDNTGAFRTPYLRLSKIGVPDRKLWYEMNSAPDPSGQDTPVFLDPTLLMRFLYGDIIEALLLFFIKESGHVVTGEQGELDIAGVLGHRDCVIDGVTVDIKSASNFSFAKFEKGTLHEDDPFGYMAQISSYIQADPDTADDGAFLAFNKETGGMTLLRVDSMDLINAEKRVEHLKEMVDVTTPPTTKCYDPVPDGKSGNMKLNKNCTYCHFKEDCWSSLNGGIGLRKFQYSTGIKYLTEVTKAPRVEEIT